MNYKTDIPCERLTFKKFDKEHPDKSKEEWYSKEQK